MANPYVGEIRMFAGNFAPSGWFFCNGQSLAISDYDTLFNLIGTTYGGDGQSTFNLPDLQGRLPVHMGTGPGLSARILGQKAGSETVTLTSNQIPSHNHLFIATMNGGNQSNPTNQTTAQAPAVQIYIEDTPDANFASNMIGPMGGSQPHTNIMPYLCVNFIISLYGIYPSQS